MSGHLDQLEAEAIHVLREAAALTQDAVSLFSGGKDSIVLAYLAVKAFYPASPPFRLLHVDTGHNFPETLEFRDRFAERFGFELVVRRVEDSITAGRVCEESGPRPSRNALQTVTLLDALAELQAGAALGGARRDEEKARAKERFFSHRDVHGQWQPRGQRPELWSLFSAEKSEGEHFRIFPLSNFTELDIWHYIRREGLELPSLYFAHQREVVETHDGVLLARGPWVQPLNGEKTFTMSVRFRTLGDMTCSGAVPSQAQSLDAVITEIAASRVSERSGRADDRRSEAAMEERKLEGYF